VNPSERIRRRPCARLAICALLAIIGLMPLAGDVCAIACAAAPAAADHPSMASATPVCHEHANVQRESGAWGSAPACDHQAIGVVQAVQTIGDSSHHVNDVRAAILHTHLPGAEPGPRVTRSDSPPSALATRTRLALRI
jgi:hypothetical protein